MITEIKSPNFLALLLESGDYFDFTIKCQGVEFKVHRAVVCAQSTMLKKAADGPFKEAVEARINLTEEDPYILSHVIAFMYTNDYNCNVVMGALQAAIASSTYKPAIPQDKAGINLANDLTVHALVYKYADMLDIDLLKQLASERFVALTASRSIVGHSSFAKPLRTMFESTRSDDTYLRLPTLTYCISKYAELVADTVEVIMEHEPTAWTVAVKCLRDVAAAAEVERKQNAGEQQKTLHKTLVKLDDIRCCEAEECGASIMVDGVYRLGYLGGVHGFCDIDCADNPGNDLA